MKADFGRNKKSKGSKTFISEVSSGDFEHMMKHREDHLPEIEKQINKVLKDYDGGSITIIVQREDENGMPDHTELLMAGTASIESQIAMAQAIRKAADSAMEVLMESCKGNTSAMLRLAALMMDEIKEKGK